MRPRTTKDGKPVYKFDSGGRIMMGDIMIGDKLVPNQPLVEMDHEVTPTQVDVGARVLNLLDQKIGEVILTYGYMARVKYDDGTTSDHHFGRLAPEPGAEGVVGE